MKPPNLRMLKIQDSCVNCCYAAIYDYDTYNIDSVVKCTKFNCVISEKYIFVCDEHKKLEEETKPPNFRYQNEESDKHCNNYLCRYFGVNI